MAYIEGQFDVVKNLFKALGINLNARHVNVMTQEYIIMMLNSNT